MTIRTRLIILSLCVVVFLIVAPYIVLYSLGYRVDFGQLQIRGTGGIYVHAQPDPSFVIIDEKPAQASGYFSSAVFMQNLVPGPHSVLIKKDGYYDYHKILTVQEKEVVKLENVTLFKTNIAFTALADIPANTTTPTVSPAQQFAELAKKPADIFVLKKNALYYREAPENAELTVAQKAMPVIKNVADYHMNTDAVIWLGLDGLLYTSDLKGQNTQTLSSSPLPAVKNMVISPDRQKMVYFGEHQMFISLSADNHKNATVLDTYVAVIGDVQWINSDYLIISTANSIIISEIDTRGNINKITIPAPALKNPQLFFSQQDKKLYILSQNNLIVSERLVP